MSSTLLERLRRVQGKEQASHGQKQVHERREPVVTVATVDPHAHKLAQFDAWLPIMANAWGYSEQEIAQINAEWRRMPILDAALATWKMDAEGFGLRLPEIAVGNGSARKREDLLDDVEHRMVDEKWLHATLQQFPCEEQVALAEEYGRRYHDGLDDPDLEKRCKWSPDAAARRANAWLHDLAVSRFPEAMSAIKMPAPAAPPVEAAEEAVSDGAQEFAEPRPAKSKAAVKKVAAVTQEASPAPRARRRP